MSDGRTSFPGSEHGQQSDEISVEFSKRVFVAHYNKTHPRPGDISASNIMLNTKNGKDSNLLQYQNNRF